ncbi:MAG: hypothetical protein R3346_03705 [Candidatus Spechtbacterales bacterium]|nr:hypothetical protein [Candidatus Spechtbacterales bacterium]
MNYISNISDKILSIPHKQVWFAFLFSATSLVVLGGIFWMFMERGFHPWLLGILLVAGILWSSMVALAFLFVEKSLLYAMFGFLSLILIVLFGFQKTNIIGIILFIIVSWLAYKRGERMRRFLAEFRPIVISMKSMTIFFTGLAILLAFTYHNFIFEDYYKDGLRVSGEVYPVVFEPIEQFLELILPGYEEGMTVKETENVIKSSFIVWFLPEEIENSEEVINESPTFLDEDISSLTLQELSLEWINQTLENTIQPYGEVMPAIFIVGLFFAFRFMLWPFMWVSLGALLLEMKLLSLYNILTVKEVTVEKEVLSLE